MDNLNLPPFYIGETVEYITGNSMLKSTKVIVTHVFKTECGCWNILFNNSNSFIIGEDVECPACNKIFSYSEEELYTGRVGWLASSFRSLQESTFPSLTWSKVLEKESELISMN